MTRSRFTRRGGFTLLEVLLASSLAIILMAALYVALDVQLRLAADGRDAIDQATLTRAIVQRFENDLAGGLGPVAPPIGNAGGMGMGAGGGGGAGAAPTGGGTPAPMGDSGAEPTTGPAITEEVVGSNSIPFQAGVIGESDRLTLYVARVASMARTDETSDAPTPADIRRVTYWLAAGGLARQELPWVTSERIQTTTEPDFGDGKEESDYVIAEEVTQLQFEYWDGSAWTDTWDGRQTNADGQTLKGPPMAIRIRFWLRVPGTEPGETVEKEFRHTIAIRGAPGPAVPETEMPPAEE
jgi:hypothetical protein